MRFKYTLEVYGPGDRKTAHAVFSSETPFGSIHKGDLFNPVIRPEETWLITEVEHFVWGAPEALTHKIVLHTDAVKAH